MIARRVLAGSILCAALVAQAEPPNPKIVERYKQMLAEKPVEGTALDRLWKVYLEQNQTTQLIDEYRVAGTFASEMVLGHLLRKAARAGEAAEAYRRAAELEAGSALPWLALAPLRTEMGEHAAAAEALEKAVAALPQKDPRIVEALIQLGGAWLAAGEVEKAAEAWERTVALDPKNLDLRRRLADACQRNHLPERARVHLEYLEQYAPPQEKAQALQQLARLHQGAGEQDAAIAALEKALAQTAPGNWLRAELQSQLIRLHQRYHRVPELEERWRQNAADNPRDLAAYLQLIDLYERTGELEREREWLEKLIARAPKTPEYRLKLARLLVQSDQLEAGAARYDELLKEQPGNVDLVFERARLDVQREAMDAARTRIAELLRARPNDETVRGKALEFYETNRLHDLLEAQLRADAVKGDEEPLLALANFLFVQQRATEAQAVLDRLVPVKATPEQQAAAFFKQAQIFKGQSDLASAGKALRKGIALAAQPREMWTLLGEIEIALGHPAEARAALEKALSLSRNPAEQIEADQKLFESFRNETPPRTDARRSTLTLAVPATTEVPAPNLSPQSYLLGITRGVAEQPTAEGWLRVARWNLWSRNPRLALEYAQKALALDSTSIAAHELIIKVASAEPQTGVARRHLQELSALDPKRKTDYQRRAGQLELQAGRLDDARRIFTELAEASPGNTEALTDLALTQQRAEDWENALATWKKIHALTPASRQKEVVAPMLRVFERLNLHQPAAELLLRQIDAQGSEKEQFALFQDLLNHCAKHGLIPWLRDELEKRRKLRADDYFTEMALGRILKFTGNKAAAFEVLADASFAAPNQAAALPELVREAEDLRKPDAAVRLQAQLVRILPQSGPDALAKLAQLQEKACDFESAGRTWEKVVAKFPRDASALELATEFHLRLGDTTRAAPLLRRIRGLDPANVRALAQLAQLDLEAGETVEARECLEQILARSTPADAAEPLRIPGVKTEERGRLPGGAFAPARAPRARMLAATMRALREFWADDEKPSRSDRDWRLNAIRDLGRLVQLKNEPAALAAWIERWRAPGVTPTETLWALYFAGASGPLLDQIQTLLAASPDDAQLKQAFIWLALQTGEFERLGAWHLDKQRTSVERDYLHVALGQYLQARASAPDPALIAQLFPEGYRLRLWQTAAVFGSHGWLREATALGERVFAGLSTQRAGYGLELAHWHLYLGEIEAARHFLRESLRTPGESYDAQVFSALREYYLLLPEPERASFAETFSASLDDAAQPVHAALARALLAGLSGQQDEAEKQLLRLLALRPMSPLEGDEVGNSGSRYWDFVLATGAQLQVWKLDRLAVFLWDTALRDTASIRLEAATQGAQIGARTNEIRARLVALQLLRASPFDAATLMEKYEREARGHGFTPVAENLETLGAYAQAILVHREVWEREPGNPHALRNLLSACRTGSDFETLEEVLGRCVRDGLFRANDAVHRDLAMQLADLLERRGANAQARIILGEAIDNAPADARLLEKLAQLHERAGRRGEAESAYRRWLQMEPANATARVALATLLQAQNRAPAAIEVLEKSSGAEVDGKLVQLYLAADRLDDAIVTLERLAAPNQLSAALLLAAGLAEKGDAPMARNILRQTIARSGDARANQPLQGKLIELLDPAADKATVPREVQRLRRMTAGQADLLGGYYELMIREAARLGYATEFARELAEDWEDGAGLPAAGVAWLEWNLQNGNEAGAQAAWSRLLARDDLTEALWAQTIAVLEKAQRPELAVQAHARLARRSPLNAARQLDWARALVALNRPAEAQPALEALSWRAVLNEEVAGQAAKLFAQIGQSARARALFAAGVAADPAGRNFRLHLDYAKLLIEAGETATARHELRVAFRNPANRECADLVAFFVATGRLARFDEEIPAFELRPQMLLATRRAIFAHYEKQRDAAGAAALLAEHPEIMEAGLSGRLRALATAAGAFEKVAAAFEKIVAQAPRENLEAAVELAALYGEWAEADLANLQEDAALVHLQRGQVLKPDFFPITRRLAELLHGRGDAAGAARIVQDFLTTSQNAAEKEEARQLLARIER